MTGQEPESIETPEVLEPLEDANREIVHWYPRPGPRMSQVPVVRALTPAGFALLALSAVALGAVAAVAVRSLVQEREPPLARLGRDAWRRLRG